MKKVPDEILNDPNGDDNNRLFFWEAMQRPDTRVKIEADFRAMHSEDFETAWPKFLKWLCIDE